MVFRGKNVRPDEPVPCPSCAWESTFARFHQSWQHRELWGGNALTAFRSYVATYPNARTYRDRLLLIDRLIHAFHVNVRETFNRAAGENLIEGSKKQVLELLDTLAYGDAGQPETRAGKEQWRQEWHARSQLKRGIRPPAGTATEGEQ